MGIVIINPNSTVSMTAAMLDIAKKALPSTQISGWTSHLGPPAIQGEEDGALAAPPLLELVRKADAQGADGVVIGCFDDTALRDASRVAGCPVIGIGQASYHYAALRGWRFSVVTTLKVSVPIIEENIVRLGLASHLGRVRASNVPVLELEADPPSAQRRIIEEARSAAENDGIDAVILGCAGMVHVTEAARAALDMPVIDPVETAARAFAWL